MPPVSHISAQGGPLDFNLGMRNYEMKGPHNDSQSPELHLPVQMRFAGS